MKILLPAYLDGFSPRKDRSISIRFVTQEQSPQQAAQIYQLLDSYGYLYFRAEEKLDKETIAELDKLESDIYDSPKTQSQRIRNNLYVNWDQNKEGYARFADYYRAKTEQIISFIKSKREANI